MTCLFFENTKSVTPLSVVLRIKVVLLYVPSFGIDVYSVRQKIQFIDKALLLYIKSDTCCYGRLARTLGAKIAAGVIQLDPQHV